MKALEIRRIEGVYPPDKVVECYRRFGIVVLKDYLPSEKLLRLRSVIETRLEAARSHGGVLVLSEFPEADFLLGDILAMRELAEVDHIFFRPELLAVARQVLNTEQLVYWGDSSIQFGEAARGFHKDNVGRYDSAHEDWTGDYGLVRCGFYFQDHVKSSGGLKVRLKSHNISNHRVGEVTDVATSFGDLVLWNMRLTHSGNNRKLRLFSGLSIHPRLESVLPKWMTLPAQKRRISAFCAFGSPGPHLNDYIRNMNAREADYKPYFQRARKADEAANVLLRYGVSFLKPNDYYGELDGLHE